VATPHPGVLGQTVLKLLMLGKLMETLVRVGTAEKGEHAPSPSSLCIKLETKGLYGWPYDYESMGLAALGVATTTRRQGSCMGLMAECPEGYF